MVKKHKLLFITLAFVSLYILKIIALSGFSGINSAATLI